MKENICNRWTEEELDLLKKNYSTMGGLKLSKLINKTGKQINGKAVVLGIKVSKKRLKELYKERAFYVKPEKQFHEYNINPNIFLNINMPETAYILGVLWADGYVLPKEARVQLSCLLEDIKEYKIHFDKLGLWRFRTYNYPNRRSQGLLTTSNKHICQFLTEHNYLPHCSLGADKILSKISDNLKKYFFIGLIDGDGCFYMNKKTLAPQFSIASNYNQDWSYVGDLLKSLNIRYSIYQATQIQNNRINKGSTIKVTSRKDLCLLIDYLYSDNNFGLTRKRDKAFLIKSIYENKYKL